MEQSITMYTQYIDYLRSLTTLPAPFKRHPAYRAILEHVSPELGEAYLRCLRDETSLRTEHIVAFCATNDAIGDPLTYTIGDLPHPVSPTSLRYLYHAARILHSTSSRRFVEVGGGYGGLARALHFLAPVEDYHIVDLEEALGLQRLVLSDIPTVSFHSASTYGDAVPDGCFFISNYCLSEIDAASRAQYVSRLLPRCPHGFLVWNFIPVTDIGKEVTRSPERPMTGPGNEFVEF